MGNGWNPPIEVGPIYCPRCGNPLELKQTGKMFKSYWYCRQHKRLWMIRHAYPEFRMERLR